ncbi:LamG-like jellyroll fold domain-containing protein [Geomesophilobacter sediminis]|uniref:LamG-like jellyroll fold domain-containing protein n=1 Tax=Geomesophilobacter sediminis TaxID=2798584 RepID=A0A8J7M0B1_9BACT|nr:LamG-like jellyroll fold domain-containing protein [Geomesophilobacter sediminis]MBJ6724257.1 hypothetical protein [Geomesophilobacter sediminis]
MAPAVRHPVPPAPQPAGLWRLVLLLFGLALLWAGPAAAGEPWAGFFFTPQANGNGNHNRFLAEFEELVRSLKAKGINTIVFDMNYGAFHFTSDYRMGRASYPANRGFSRIEARRMAQIARENGMQVMVALQVLTHSVGNVFPYVYPQYMLAGREWRPGVLYTAYEDWVSYRGKSYLCTSTRRSTPDNAPGPKAFYWREAPTNTRDPFNKEGEQVVFKMMDELVEAFTVDGIPPEGFHIGCDEVGWWYAEPRRETGMSSAQVFALAVTNAYRHLQEKHPGMEVIMWGDMLDPAWNGMPRSEKYNLSGRDTAAALDLIPKGIIIADWRYEANQRYRYDDARQSFPSVAQFAAQGFRVWPTSWADVKATRDLVWTGNEERARTGKVVGHLYSTWLMGIVPEFTRLLADSGRQVPDTLLADVGAEERSRYRGYYRGIADAINQTGTLIGARACRGTDRSCGAYPDCRDLTVQSGFYGGSFREYSCRDNRSAFRTLSLPVDYAGAWRLNGVPDGAAGAHQVALKNGARLAEDPVRGKVAYFSGYGPNVRVRHRASLDPGSGSFSIGAWFKAGPGGGLGTIVSKDPGFRCYNLFLDPEGMIWFETNGVRFYRYSAPGVSYRDAKWHHVVAVFDAGVPTIDLYLDGALANGKYVFIDGTNVKSSPSDLFIGNNDGNGAYQFLGWIGDVVLFNRVLSAGEVKMMYLAEQRPAARKRGGAPGPKAP